LERVKKKLRKAGKSNQTIKHALGLIKRIANFGHKKGLCPGLSIYVEMPTLDNAKTETLTQDQLANLFKVLEEEPNIQIK